MGIPTAFDVEDVAGQERPLGGHAPYGRRNDAAKPQPRQDPSGPLKEFLPHYHIERPHQGLGNKLLTASASEPPKNGDVVVDERLGGLLRSYRRPA